MDMVTDAIMDCSRRGGLIADAFAGSGTTFLAAAKSGRVRTMVIDVLNETSRVTVKAQFLFV